MYKPEQNPINQENQKMIDFRNALKYKGYNGRLTQRESATFTLSRMLPPFLRVNPACCFSGNRQKPGQDPNKTPAGENK
jgi:hypothetical protein